MNFTMKTVYFTGNLKVRNLPYTGPSEKHRRPEAPHLKPADDNYVVITGVTGIIERQKN